MKDSIYTIPVSEVFEPKCDCPICRMRDMLENRCTEYIMGAAMMEPDIRIETNRLSFCHDHFAMMLKMKNRLSLALMLESGLADIRQNGYKDILDKVNAKDKKRIGMKTINDTCFVCSQIEDNMEKMLSTVIKRYLSDPEFKQLFEEQEYICLPHLELLLTVAKAKMRKKDYEPFSKVVIGLTDKYMKVVNDDVSHFCKMYDYRNAGGDWGNSRDSIERAILLLSTRDHRTKD